MALTYRTGKQARWFNGDNLTVYFPGSAAAEVRGGQLSGIGGENATEVYVTLAELPVLSSDANGLLLADTVKLPGGAFITKLETLVVTETAGVNSNLNLGIVNATTMAITDADYLLAAADIENAGTDVGLETARG
jgi:hypothetical protein